MKKKLCKKCGLEKPLGEVVKDSSKKDGYKYLCRLCDNKQAIQWYTEHKEEAAITHKKWQENNKERYAANAKRWREDNKERKAANDKRWYEENKEHCAAKMKQWYEENKEHYAAKKKQWRETERGKLLSRLKSQRRRQRKRNLATDHDLITQEWLEIVAAQNNHCALCGEHFPIEELTADHIYPLKLGGLFVKENAQAACGPCNSSKGTKTMEEFWESRKCR